MITFLLGFLLLVVGGFLYSKVSVRLFNPTDRVTPAHSKEDGMDFIPMSKWKNALINLLNIAGTGPVLGPIQGILFGPIAFLTIPIGCILGGAVHDYWCGMISLRNDGAQMPKLVEKYLGKGISKLYFVFLIVLLMLVGVVFVYTPGDLFVGQVMGLTSASPNYVLVTVLAFAAIFLYYIIATMMPIDKIIGKVYPIFGVILFVSALAVFIITVVGAATGRYTLNEVWDVLPDWAYTGLLNPSDPHYIPTFFVTVACGIVSGFHSSQVTLISRTADSEKDGSLIFFGMMLTEGFIAMAWAAGAMVIYNMMAVSGGTLNIPGATQVVGLISKEMLSIFWIVPVASVIILPITSGDTAFRAVRILIQDAFNIQKSKKSNLLVAVGIFAVGILLLVWAKTSSDGFNILWRYFGFANQTIAVFTFAVITVYMIQRKLPYLMALIPGAFYMFIVVSFILHQPIGFNISNWTICYAAAGVLTVVYFVLVLFVGKKRVKTQGVATE